MLKPHELGEGGGSSCLKYQRSLLWFYWSPKYEPKLSAAGPNFHMLRNELVYPLFSPVVLILGVLRRFKKFLCIRGLLIFEGKSLLLLTFTLLFHVFGWGKSNKIKILNMEFMATLLKKSHDNINLFISLYILDHNLNYILLKSSSIVCQIHIENRSSECLV